ncbi:methyltransferase [Spongorhabdus nitratireducens]
MTAYDRTTLYQMAMGHWKFQTTLAVAKLGIADQLADQPLSAADIAANTGLNSDRLERVLRTLASDGIFNRLPDGRFSNNEASHYLRSNIAGTMKDLIIMNSREWISDAWLNMTDSLEASSDQSPFKSRFDQEIYEYLGTHNEENALFDRVMQQLTSYGAETTVDLLPLAGTETVTDLGGGTGAFLLKLLSVYPGIQCTLLEQPVEIERAARSEDIQHHSSHFQLVTGSFFEDIPQGQDVYILKAILHGFNQDRCERILQNCQAAMHGDSRLFVIDHIAGDGPEHAHANWYDLLMMQIGGREIDLPRFTALLDKCGLELAETTVRSGMQSVLEIKIKS